MSVLREGAEVLGTTTDGGEAMARFWHSEICTKAVKRALGGDAADGLEGGGQLSLAPA
jgi:hypothetical protein